MYKLLSAWKENIWYGVGPMAGKRLSNEHKRKLCELQILRLQKNKSRISKSCAKFLDALEKIWNVKIEREFSLDGRLFDGKVENLLIEIDGKFWHQLPIQIKIDEKKNRIAKNHKYKLKRFEINRESDIPKTLNQIKFQM